MNIFQGEKIMEALDMVIYYNFNDQRVAMRTGSILRFLPGDHIGSTAITTNISGAFQAEQRYYPWGEKRTYYGSFPTIPRASGQDYQFTSGPMKTLQAIKGWRVTWAIIITILAGMRLGWSGSAGGYSGARGPHTNRAA